RARRRTPSSRTRPAIRSPKQAAQPRWSGVPAGSSSGMYPAVEINLHLEHVSPAQPSSRTASGYAFRSSVAGTNLLPHRRRLVHVGLGVVTPGGKCSRTEVRLGRLWVVTVSASCRARGLEGSDLSS